MYVWLVVAAVVWVFVAVSRMTWSVAMAWVREEAAWVELGPVVREEVARVRRVWREVREGIGW